MLDASIETPAPSQRVVCDNCGKDYKTRATLMQHVRVYHKAHVRVDSPLGNFPSSNLNRVLFDDND